MRRLELTDNIDMLRAFLHTRTALNTVDSTLVSIFGEHIGTLGIIKIFEHHSGIVFLEYSWNIHLLRTWHAVFTAGAGDGDAAFISSLCAQHQIPLLLSHRISHSVRFGEDTDIIL